MKRLLNSLLLLVLVLSLIVSCTAPAQMKSIESTEEDVLIEEPINKPPVANAGEDIECYTGEDINLCGTDSNDPDGNPLSFHWTIRGKDYYEEIVTFNFTEPGTYYRVTPIVKTKY
jgi:hypothetical protein